jgi:hypothetical protein
VDAVTCLSKVKQFKDVRDLASLAYGVLVVMEHNKSTQQDSVIDLIEESRWFQGGLHVQFAFLFRPRVNLTH